MKTLLVMTVVLLLGCWSSLATAAEQEEKINFVEFQKILDTKCGKCHTRNRIEQAIAQGKAFGPIEERMVGHGAELTDRERDVMGVFWVQNPSRQVTPVPRVEDDPLADYRSVLEARCTGCHTLERVEEAMRENRSFEDLAKMMLERGAVLTEADRKVIGTFWGEPLR